MPNAQMKKLGPSRSAMGPDLTGISSDLIGFSEEARPIRVLYAGDELAPLRILILAGQHGDESRGRDAVRRFAHAGPARADPSVPVGLALVPDGNPDGTARSSRTNARDVDLNRDHLRLEGAETRALHRFVRTWRPDLIVDVHDFRPRRRYVLTRELVSCHDVFLDVPTHPGAQHRALGREGSRLLEPVLSGLCAAGYRTARYTRVTRSGRVCQSTPDVLDARNGLALRYGIPTVLVEGRGSSRTDDSALEAHVLGGVEQALSGIVCWAQENYAALTEPRSQAVASEVTLPKAYAVPCTHGVLLELLRRQAFPLVPAAPDRVERIERYWVEELRPARRPNRAPRALKLSVRTEQRPLADHMLVPVTEDGGAALAVFLEPTSKHGLARFADMHLPLTSQSAYPVLRVM
jgi:hypothetical protein